MLNGFREIIQRSGISQIEFENGIMYGRNSNNASVIIAPGKELWSVIQNDEEMKSMMQPLDATSDLSKRVAMVMGIVTENSNDWIDLDTDTLYKGKIIKISVDGFEYDITINRDMLPLKLKKAEYNNIRYRIRLMGDPILIVQKEFKQVPPDCDYTMSRVFQII